MSFVEVAVYFFPKEWDCLGRDVEDLGVPGRAPSGPSAPDL